MKNKNMKYLIGIGILLLCVIGIFRAEIIQALFVFLITGAIPGTNISIGGSAMFITAILLAIIFFVIPFTKFVLKAIRNVFDLLDELLNERKPIRQAKN